MPSRKKPGGTVASSSKQLCCYCLVAPLRPAPAAPASRLYQLKISHCLTGQYLNWAKSRPTARCWWCSCRAQMRDHQFKVCPERKETGRWGIRFTVRDLLANVRCSQAVLDFLSTTDVGRLAPAEEYAGSEVSEWEREEERRAEAEVLGAGGGTAFPTVTLVHGVRRREVGKATLSFVLFLLFFGYNFLGAHHVFWERAWRAGNEHRARTADRHSYLCQDLSRSHASND